MNELGAFLRAARGKQAKKEVERATHVTRGSIIRAESGAYIPTMRTLRKLCRHYGVSFSKATDLWTEAHKTRLEKQ